MVRSNHPARTGFTIIELLVVLSIIALLIALLLPAINAVRSESRMLLCGTNMRQISIASASFGADNKTRIPIDDSNAQFDYYAIVFLKHMGTDLGDIASDTNPNNLDETKMGELFLKHTVFQCPEMPLEEVDYHGIHYAIYQGMQTGSNVDHLLRINLDGTRNTRGRYAAMSSFDRNPSAIGHLMDGGIFGVRTQRFLAFHTYDHVPYTPLGVIGGGHRTVTEQTARHKGRSPLMFLDGHAEMLAVTPDNFPATLWAWSDEQYTIALGP